MNLSLFTAGAHRVGSWWAGPLCYDSVPFDVHVNTLVVYFAISVTAFFALDIRGKWNAQVAAMTALTGAAALHRIPLDTVFGLACASAYVMQIYYKLATHMVIYLLQPCHMLCLSSAVMLLHPRPWLAPLVNIQLPWMMGALAAILMPDLEGLVLPFERHVFFIEHGLVVLAPLYLLCRHRGAAAQTTGVFSSVLGAWTMFLYHSALAQPVSLLTGVNINYMLCATPELMAIIRLVFHTDYIVPSYHTPVYIMVPILSQVLHSVYLGTASLCLACGRSLGLCQPSYVLAVLAPSKGKAQ